MKNNYSVGVDLGGTRIKIGLVNSSGRIIKKISIDTFAKEGPEKVVSQIKKGIHSLLDKNKKTIQGIGIGSPGTVSLKKLKLFKAAFLSFYQTIKFRFKKIV